MDSECVRLFEQRPGIGTAKVEEVSAVALQASVPESSAKRLGRQPTEPGCFDFQIADGANLLQRAFDVCLQLLVYCVELDSGYSHKGLGPQRIGNSCRSRGCSGDCESAF